MNCVRKCIRGESHVDCVSSKLQWTKLLPLPGIVEIQLTINNVCPVSLHLVTWFSLYSILTCCVNRRLFLEYLTMCFKWATPMCWFRSTSSYTSLEHWASCSLASWIYFRKSAWSTFSWFWLDCSGLFLLYTWNTMFINWISSMRSPFISFYWKIQRSSAITRLVVNRLR